MPRSLSILLPVHNQHAALRRGVVELLEAAAEITGQFEIMIVDDGSTDDSVDAAVELALQYPQVGVARHALPLGRAAALRTAFDRTQGDVLFVRDAAWQLDVHELGRLWKLIDAHELVFGWPIGTVQPALPRPRVPWRTWGADLLPAHDGADLASAWQMVRRDTALRIGWPRIEGMALLAALPHSGYDWAQVEIRDTQRRPAAPAIQAGPHRAPRRTSRLSTLRAD